MFAGTQSKLDYARPHMTLNGLQAGEIMRRQIKPATLAVFVALYSHCRADWVCFPSRKRMAAMTGLSDRAVTSALGDLVKMEWIRRLGATPAGVLRYQLTAPSVPVGAGTVLPPPLEVSFPLKEEGRESKALLEEEGGPSVVLPSTQDWEEFSAFWPGPQTKEARGRYFALARETSWLAKDIRQRAECFLEFQKDLDRTTPTLAGVLDPSFLKLGDLNLKGMQAIADEEKQRRTRRRG